MGTSKPIQKQREAHGARAARALGRAYLRRQIFLGRLVKHRSGSKPHERAFDRVQRESRKIDDMLGVLAAVADAERRKAKAERKGKG